MIRPILDRVLLRRIKEKQEGPIVKPDAYHESMRFTIVEIGDFVILAGQRFPLIDFVNVGDVVLVHQYDVEEISVDGETLHLTRVQNIKGVEKHANVKLRADWERRRKRIESWGEQEKVVANPSAT